MRARRANRQISVIEKKKGRAGSLFTCRSRLPTRLTAGQLFLLLAFLGFLQTCVGAGCKLVLEFLDPTRRIDEFELARVERVTSTADIQLEFRTSAASHKRVPATASNFGFLVFRVNIRLHDLANLVPDLPSL